MAGNKLRVDAAGTLVTLAIGNSLPYLGVIISRIGLTSFDQTKNIGKPNRLTRNQTCGNN